MGCCKGKPKPVAEVEEAHEENETANNPQKIYSWTARNTLNQEDFKFKNKFEEVFVTNQSELRGQHYLIQNCNFCKVFVMESLGSVIVENCEHCFIFLGPVKSSIFLRNCTDCKVVATCQQLRTRDCKRIDFHLFCSTNPSLEASFAIKFKCIQAYYPGMEDHMRIANLNPFCNKWSEIYDFTPPSSGKNYSFLSDDTFYRQDLPSSGIASTIWENKQKSCVPFTTGNQLNYYKEGCFIFFFYEPQQKERVFAYLTKLWAKGLSITKTHCLTPEQVSRIFKDKPKQSGQCLAIEVRGEDVANSCKVVAKETEFSFDKGVSPMVIGSEDQNLATNLEAALHCPA